MADVKKFFLTKNQFIKKFDSNGDNQLDSSEIEQIQNIFANAGESKVRIGSKRVNVSDLESVFGQSNKGISVQTQSSNSIFGNNAMNSSGAQTGLTISSSSSGGIGQLESQADELKKTANEKGIKGFFKKIGKAISGALKKQAKAVEASGKNIEAKESANANQQKSTAESAKSTAQDKMGESENLASSAQSMASAAGSVSAAGGTSTVAGLAMQAMSFAQQNGGSDVNLSQFNSLQSGEMNAIKDMGIGDAIKAKGMAKLTNGKGILGKVGSLLKVGKMISGIAKTLKALGPTLETVATTLKTVASAVAGIPIVGQILSAALKVIGTVIKGVAKGIKAIGKVIGKIGSKIGKVVGKLKKAGDKLVKGGQKIVKKGADKFAKSKLAKGKFVTKAKALYAKITSGKNANGKMNLIGKGRNFMAENGVSISRKGISMNGGENSFLGDLNIKASRNGVGLSLDDSPLDFGYNRQQGFNLASKNDGLNYGISTKGGLRGNASVSTGENSEINFNYSKYNGFNSGFNYENGDFFAGLGLNQKSGVDLEAMYEQYGFKFA